MPFIEQAEKNHVPILGTSRPTSEFMAELIYTLAEKLAPSITVHGVLVDVYGEGLMITGRQRNWKKRGCTGTDPSWTSTCYG